MNRQGETNPTDQPNASPQRPQDAATRKKLAFRYYTGETPTDWTEADDRAWRELKAREIASRRLPPSAKETSIRGSFIVEFEAASTNEQRLQLLRDFLEQHFESAITWPWFKERRDELARAGLPLYAPTHAIGPASASAEVTAAATSPKGFDGLGEKNRDWSEYFDSAALTERQRECASMRWEYDLSVAEIARRLGRDRKTVQERLAAANRKMACNQDFKRALKRRAAHSRSHDESD